MEYVYLDLNMWIDLHMRDEDDEVREQVEMAVENGEIALPIIHTILTEEATFENEQMRKEVFDYMFELSATHSLRPFTDVQSFEIERFVRGIGGDFEYDLEERVRGKGVDDLFGDWSLTIDGEELDPEGEYQEVFEELNQMFQNRRGFEVTTGAVKQTVEETGDWESELHEEIEKIIDDWDDHFDDNARRRRYAKYSYFYDSVFLPLAQRFVESNLYYNFGVYDFEEYVNQGDEDVEDLLRLFPANYTYVTLTNAADLQDGRKPNDVYDLFSLAVAIPYCDIVVTENVWRTESERAGLTETYGTEMVSSLDDLTNLI